MGRWRFGLVAMEGVGEGRGGEGGGRRDWWGWEVRARGIRKATNYNLFASFLICLAAPFSIFQNQKMLRISNAM